MATFEKAQDFIEDNRVLSARVSDQAAEIERLKRDVGRGAKAEAKLAERDAEIAELKQRLAERDRLLDSLQAQLKSATQAVAIANLRRDEALKHVESLALSRAAGLS